MAENRRPPADPRHRSGSDGNRATAAVVVDRGGGRRRRNRHRDRDGRRNSPPADSRAGIAIAVGRLTRITTEPGLEMDPAISPDGRAIAYAAGAPGNMRIYLRQIAGGRMVPLTDETGPAGQRWPQWSSDGTRIVFQAGRPQLVDRGKAPRSSSRRRSAASPAGSRVRSRTISRVLPTWSHDDRQIAFGGAAGLYVMPADGSAPPTLVAPEREAHSPAWSHDGRRIVFVSRGIGFTFGASNLGNVSTSAIVTVDVDTRKSTPLTNGDWLDTSPVWMPDGRAVLFVSSRGGGRDVFHQRLNADGRPEGEPVRVSSGLNAHGISVSRDGRLLAYSTYVQRANIWSDRDPPGPGCLGARSTASDVRQREDRKAGDFPGRRVAGLRFGSRRSREHLEDASGRRHAAADHAWREQQVRERLVAGWPGDRLPQHARRRAARRDGRLGRRHEDRDGDEQPAEEQHSAWGPDGNSIVFDRSTSTEARNEMYVVRRANRGAPWETPRRITTDASSDPKWSPDGRWIVYSVNGELRVIAPDGTGQRVVVPRSTAVPRRASIWSHDSRTIYYKAYDSSVISSLWAVPVDGGPPRLLVTFDDPRGDRSGASSPPTAAASTSRLPMTKAICGRCS